MANPEHIRNPIEWLSAEIGTLTDALNHGWRNLRRPGDNEVPARVAKITREDLVAAMRAGVRDLGTARSDIFFLCLLYPLAGLILFRFAVGYSLLPLVFPLISGFALIGPVAALGLYEISRRREIGEPVRWSSVFGVFRAPGLPAIVVIAVILFGLFGIWLAAAHVIYLVTLGPEAPVSLGGFLRDTLTTPSGWAMIVLGVGVGGLFAVVAFALSVVSLPLLMEHNVGLRAALGLSLRVLRTNPPAMTLWGALVAVGLALGALPALLGLIFVLPLFGHSTWHLYRRVLPPDARVIGHEHG